MPDAIDIAIVVPTRNRPDDLGGLLECLAALTLPPKSVVIVDSSDDDGTKDKVRAKVAQSPLQPKLVDHWPPSAAAQRNHGLEKVGQSTQWVMLIDDDVRVRPDCLVRLAEATTRLGDRYIGFTLNPGEPEAFQPVGFVRSLALVEKLGLYSRKVGAVARSGWHTRLRHVDEDVTVEWLPTIAAVWRTAKIQNERFDEFFEGYSYLEDLEFSYRMARHGAFAILSDIEYVHLESPHGRKSQYWFGRREVRNRRYFVRKHRLSMPLFRVAMGLRIGQTLLSALTGQPGQFQRLGGNLMEVIRPAHG